MARILSVPDVHGSHQWEAVKSVPEDSYDYIVFHGDYFDSWNEKGVLISKVIAKTLPSNIELYYQSPKNIDGNYTGECVKIK